MFGESAGDIVVFIAFSEEVWNGQCVELYSIVVLNFAVYLCYRFF